METIQSDHQSIPFVGLVPFAERRLDAVARIHRAAADQKRVERRGRVVEMAGAVRSVQEPSEHDDDEFQVVQLVCCCCCCDDDAQQL